MRRAASFLTLMSMIGVAAIALASRGKLQAAHPEGQKPPRNVAILIFEGVQIIDYTGPYETFGHVYTFAQGREPFNIYTVGEKPGGLTTAMGMSVNPKYSLENSPRPDILVVPGGDVRSALNSPGVMKWVQDSAKDAEIVMSVCNGAFILAKAGLLDGLEATTTAFLIERLRAEAPKTKVVSDKRYVDNGKIITTAGLSSGIDGSLHVIEKLYGRGTAQMAALGMEYNWDPESKYVRAALADKYMPNQYDIDKVVKTWVPVERSGGVDRWESTWTITTEVSPADILQHIEEGFSHSDYFPRARNLHWVKQSDERTGGGASSLWKFSDEQGNPWSGRASVEPVARQRNTYTVKVKVQRVTSVTQTGPT